MSMSWWCIVVAMRGHAGHDRKADGRREIDNPPGFHERTSSIVNCHFCVIASVLYFRGDFTSLHFTFA